MFLFTSKALKVSVLHCSYRSLFVFHTLLNAQEQKQ